MLLSSVCRQCHFFCCSAMNWKPFISALPAALLHNELASLSKQSKTSGTCMHYFSAWQTYDCLTCHPIDTLVTYSFIILKSRLERVMLTLLGLQCVVCKSRKRPFIDKRFFSYRAQMPKEASILAMYDRLYERVQNRYALNNRRESAAPKILCKV